MPVCWWVLIKNKHIRFLLGQMFHFGIRACNATEYRADIAHSLEGRDPHPTSFSVQALDSDIWDATKDFWDQYGLSVQGCADSEIFLAVRDNKVIGQVCARRRPVYIEDFEREMSFEGVYMSHLFISPTSRGGGVARSLMLNVMWRMEREGHRCVHGFVEAHNQASRRMVNSLRFKAIREVRYLRVLSLRSFQTEDHDQEGRDLSTFAFSQAPSH